MQFSYPLYSFSWNLATFLHAYTCFLLAQATRQTASSALQDIADSGVLFALLMCDHKYDGPNYLSIKSGNGRGSVVAWVIKDITRNWAQFFRMANTMREGAPYAFAFEELAGELPSHSAHPLIWL